MKLRNIYMHKYYIERSWITRVNNLCFCYVDDISTQADFQVDGYYGFWVLLLFHNRSIPHFVMIQFHMQRFKFIVIEFCFLKKKEE